MNAPWGQAVHKYGQGPNFVIFCRRPEQTPALLPSEILDGLNRGIKTAGVNEHKDFVGHTIGIEAREFPFEFTAPKKLSSLFLPETSDVPLEENMVINVEIALVELGFGGIQIEHMLRITKNGFEFLTAEPRPMLSI